MIHLFLAVGLWVVAGQTPSPFVPEKGTCITVVEFIPTQGYIDTLPPDCSINLDGTLGQCDGEMNDWFVEVWLNDGDDNLQTNKQRSHIEHNTNMPVWNEMFCWQTTAFSVSMKLYDDENYNLQVTNMVEPISGVNTNNVKRKDKYAQTLTINNAMGERIGYIVYHYDNNVGWTMADAQDCLVDNLVIEITEPDYFKIPDATWINGPKVKIGADRSDPRGLLIKEQLDWDACSGDPTDIYGGSIALIHYSQRYYCNLEEMMYNAELAGAAAVIYAHNEDVLPDHGVTADDNVRASIPGKMITDTFYRIEFEYTRDVHNIHTWYGKFICPFKAEQDFMKDGMCINDQIWFGGKYTLLRLANENGMMQYVNVNDHAVFISDTSDNTAPVYVMNKKQLGLYTWIVTPSLTGNEVLAECGETTKRGQVMEPNDCEHWRIYDAQYDMFQDYYQESIIDFCPPDYGKAQGCSHSAAEFQITNAPGAPSIERAYTTVVALFGPAQYDTGRLEIVIIGGPNNEACSPFDPTNSVNSKGEPVDLTDKLVMVYRGACYFSMKHVNVSNAGAKAMIVINYVDENHVYMSHSSTTAPGTIPIRFMNQDDTFFMIKEVVDGLNEEVFVRGGFMCPQGANYIPPTLCVSVDTTFEDYKLDFHGTYHREKDDLNGHPTYRLDPLSNIYPVQNEGTPIQPAYDVDHTHTFLYYDQPGRADTGRCNSCNSWNIGTQLDAGTYYVYSYCVGEMGKDISTPDLCPNERWQTFNDAYDQYLYLNRGNDTIITRGNCPYDNSAGTMALYTDEDGIFCEGNSDCMGWEYCLSCKKCLKMYANCGLACMYWNEPLEHPCGYCMEQRDPTSSVDDGVCMPLMACSEGSPEETLTGTPAPVTPTCTNVCNKEGLGMESCPAEPGCDASCLTDGDVNMSLIGDGNCNGECFGCREWTAMRFFDAGDCRDQANQYILKGSLWEGYLICDFSLSSFYRVYQNVTMEIVDVQGVRATARMNFEVSSRSADVVVPSLYDLSGITGREYTIIEFPDNSFDAMYDADAQTNIQDAWGVYDWGGHVWMDANAASTVNPTGVTIRISSLNYDNFESVSCYQADLVRVTEEGVPSTPKPSKTPQTSPPTDCALQVGVPAMDACLCLNKKECDGMLGFQSQCLVKKRSTGDKTCYNVPAEKPANPSTCYYEDRSDNTGLKIKGASKRYRYRDDKAAELTPCGCRDKCLNEYLKEGPFLAYYMVKTSKIKKGTVERVATCDCFKEIKKIKTKQDQSGVDPNRSGNVIEGFLEAYLSK